jgi:hypothetical protein
MQTKSLAFLKFKIKRRRKLATLEETWRVGYVGGWAEK